MLDIGCGPGAITKIIADRVGPEGKVVGVDPDLERLEIARKRYSASNLEYVQGYAEDILGYGSDFDFVVSFYALHWCKDKDSVVKQVAAILKPGGKFGVVGINIDNSKYLSPAEMFSEAYRAHHMEACTPISPSEVREIASRNNFKVLFLKEFVREEKFEGVKEVVEQHMMHALGEYDETHFNVEAMKRHYGEGEVTVNKEMISFVLEKC